MRIIQKITEDDVELLPDVVDTFLWELGGAENFKAKKKDRQLCNLYSLLAERENYYQFYSPTAFGDPKYLYLDGRVSGFLRAMECTEEREGVILVFE